MADIDLTITPEAQIEVFGSIPGGAEGDNVFPRARVIFELDATVIPAKIATNSTTITINCNVPQNFAYALDGITVTTVFATNIADAGHFNDNAFYTVLPNGTGTIPANVYPLLSTGLQNRAGQGGSLKTWRPTNLSGQVFVNQGATLPRVQLILSDNDLTNATVAGTVSMRVSLLQYDVEQALNVRVNAPMPVVAR